MSDQQLSWGTAAQDSEMVEEIILPLHYYGNS
jgi:hypothetical protein